jgi:Ca2+/Na+ antiporter
MLGCICVCMFICECVRVFCGCVCIRGLIVFLLFCIIQRNRGDRFSLMFVIALIFAAMLTLPILFCLKTDATLSSRVTWVDIWTPMWMVDAVMLIFAVLIFCTRTEEDDDDDDSNHEELDRSSHRNKQDENNRMSVVAKVVNLVQTVLFIAIQVMVMGKLDDSFSMDWLKVFIPWFAYESINILRHAPVALTTPTPPSTPDSDASGLADSEDAEQEALLKQYEQEAEYLERLVNQSRAKHGIMNSLLRIWFALFLAWKLDDNSETEAMLSSWAIVLLPVWIMIAFNMYYSSALRQWGESIVAELAASELSATEQQQPQTQKMALSVTMKGYSSTLCCMQSLLLMMAVLLVIRLQQIASYSAFIILLPVFVIIGCCCCLVFCSLCAYATVDMDEIPIDVQSYGTFAATSSPQTAASTAPFSHPVRQSAADKV